MNNRHESHATRTTGAIFCAIICMAAMHSALGAATNRYVATNAPLSAWPYDSWDTAATNIKDAVDTANANNAGDNVIISNGTYYVTTAIIVSNSVVTNVTGDWTKVIVNGNYNTVTSRCFIMRHANAVLCGLTITNGWATTNQFPELQGCGGGVWASNGIVRNCLITGCRANIKSDTYGGGGIYAMSGTTMDGCSIIGNVVMGVTGMSATLLQDGGGGGACLGAATCYLTNCVVAWNTAATEEGAKFISGGGICVRGAQHIVNCSIVSNSAKTWGAGMFLRCYGSSAGSIINSTISSNKSAGSSGCMVYGSGCPAFRNCSINNNGGDALYFYLAKPGTIETCTIVSNIGRGIYFDSNCTANKTNISNCIIYYNDSGTNIVDATTGGLLKTSVWYSCVAPGSGFTIDGIVTNDPAFVDAAKGNYRLREDSPCINRGTNTDWMQNGVDLDGHKRIVRGIVDMGCYEFIYRGSIYCLP